MSPKSRRRRGPDQGHRDAVSIPTAKPSSASERPHLGLAPLAPSPHPDVLAVLASALAPYLAPLLVAAAAVSELDLVDVADAVPASRRVLYRAARLGEIEGATCVARRWLAPRASIDAWLRARGPRLAVVPIEDGEGDDGLEALRRRLAGGAR